MRCPKGFLILNKNEECPYAVTMFEFGGSEEVVGLFPDVICSATPGQCSAWFAVVNTQTYQSLPIDNLVSGLAHIPKAGLLDCLGIPIHILEEPKKRAGRSIEPEEDEEG